MKKDIDDIKSLSNARKKIVSETFAKTKESAVEATHAQKSQQEAEDKAAVKETLTESSEGRI